MTSIEHAGQQRGPITLHIDTQAADVQVVSDPRITGTLVELSTPDNSGPAVDAIRSADFRDYGNEVHLTLREGQSGNTVQYGNGNVQMNSFGGGMTIINGVVMGGTASGPITVRAMIEPGSAVVIKTMSGDIVTRGVTTVRAQTMSGDIEADGVTNRSTLKSMSGDIRVAGVGQPQVTASSMSGDVTGSGVALNGSSMSGRVRHR